VIDVREIEVAVSAGGKDPSEIMDLIHERELPGMPVLAGYHPHYSSVWKERQSSWDFGDVSQEDGSGARSKLAQGFVLAARSRVEAIDIFLYRSAGTEETISLCVQRDAEGRPSGAPAVPGTIVRFNPRENWESLNLQYQGYYKLTFNEPVILEAGKYWIVLEKDPADPSKGRRYLAHAVAGKYADGSIGQWKPETGWRNIGRSTFFGVHGQVVE